MCKNKSMRKGIILAGQSGTRLGPLTKVVCKQLLAVYDKPMIYYPLATLMMAGIREVLVITTPQDQQDFRRLLGDGSELGISIEYAVQSQRGGIAEAFIIGRDFIGDATVALALGDNILCGEGLEPLLAWAAEQTYGAMIFAHPVRNPQRYGVVVLTEGGRLLTIDEKPAQPRSNLAVPGLYFYDNRVVDYAASLEVSARGELEITDINYLYMREGTLQVERLGEGFAWFDAGTPMSLLVASNFMASLEKHQNLRTGDIEAVARQRGFITAAKRPLDSNDTADEHDKDTGNGETVDEESEEDADVLPDRIIEFKHS